MRGDKITMTRDRHKGSEAQLERARRAQRTVSDFDSFTRMGMQQMLCLQEVSRLGPYHAHTTINNPSRGSLKGKRDNAEGVKRLCSVERRVGVASLRKAILRLQGPPLLPVALKRSLNNTRLEDGYPSRSIVRLHSNIGAFHRISLLFISILLLGTLGYHSL